MGTPTVADILNLAADIIERRGLSRGRGRAPDGAVCAVIAILDAASLYEAYDLGDVARREMEAFVNPGPDPVGDALCNLAIWSDTIALDAADVANHLRKAAERSQEAP